MPYMYIICIKGVYLYNKRELTRLIKKPLMKTLTPNYATLHLGIDDLELINQALCRLLIYTKNEEKKSELSRIIWQLSQAINPELYESSDSQLMNS